MSKKVLVVLSGCGFLDGAEIHEAVATLWSISKFGAEYVVAAPDKQQHHVVNHHSGEEMNEQRNVRVEAARIARGPVLGLNEVSDEGYDALFIPGGFGAAKNLCTFAFEGAAASIDPQIKDLIVQFHEAGKPIGAVCISPALLALALGKGTLTIGTDEGTAAHLETLGATHQNSDVEHAVIDAENKLVTAPAYMADAKVHQVFAGIEEAVEAVLSSC